MVRHVANDVQRRGRAREEALARSHLTTPSPPTPAEVAELDILEAAVARAIQELPERRREVFCLAHFSGLSHQEIGAVLGMATSTAKKHMNLALGDLRRVLQPYADLALTPRKLDGLRPSRLAYASPSHRQDGQSPSRISRVRVVGWPDSTTSSEIDRTLGVVCRGNPLPSIGVLDSRI